MATVVYSCHEDDSVETAEQLMAERQVRRIPVVDDQIRPVGLLSINDVARHAAAAANRTRESEEKAVAQTMAAISQPRVEHAESTARATPNGTSSGGPRAAIH